jgi:hypothetical protein
MERERCCVIWGLQRLFACAQTRGGGGAAVGGTTINPLAQQLGHSSKQINKWKIKNKRRHRAPHLH